MMNIGDKLTWAYRSLFILMLIWLRFIEAYIPFWGIWIVWGIIVFILFKQPFKRDKGDGREMEAEQPTSPAGGVG